MKKLLFFVFTLCIIGNTVFSQPVAHWKLDGNANDELGTSNGTLINGDVSLYVSGLDGQALDLSQGADTTCIVVPSNATNDFDSTKSFTMSAFINIPDFDSNREILFKGHTSVTPDVPGSKGKWIALALIGKTLRLFVDDNVTKTNLDVQNADLKINAGAWNHIVGVRDLAQDSIFLYINGEKVGSLEDNTELNIASAPLPWVIGGGRDQNVYFDGKLDEVSLYDVALSPGEIFDMYRSFIPAPKNLAAYWELDGDATDVLGTSDGTLINGDASLYVPGQYGGAIDLSEGADTTCIVVPSNETNDFDSTQSFTMSALINIPDFNSNREILFKGHTSVTPDVPGSKGKWIALALIGKTLRMFVDDNVTKTNLDVHNADAWMVEGTWNHVVGVRDLVQDSIFLFINGEKVGSLEDNTELNIASGPLPWVIGGGRDQNVYFDGKLDEVRLYDTALSTTEIYDLYESYNLKNAPEGVVAWWRLEGNGEDELGTSDGTLMNLGDSLFVNGHTGQAINMGKGVDSSYINVPNNTIIDFDSTASFTISFLVKDDDFSESMECVFKGATGSDGADKKGKWYALSYNGSAWRMFIDDNVNKTQLDAQATKRLHLDGWNHVVGVRDLGTDSLYIYLNGEKLGSKEDITDGNIASSPLPLIIGNGQNHDSPNLGILDEIRLYNKALSEADIKSLTAVYGIEPVVLSDDATLSDLTIDGTTVPGFDPGTSSYSVTLPVGTTTASIGATANHSGAIVSGTGDVDLSSGSGNATVVVTAEDGSTGEYSVALSVEVDALEESQSEILEIYPNPALNSLTIECEVGISEVYIHNALGQLVQSIVKNRSRIVSLEVVGLVDGVYFINVVTVNNDRVNTTFIKK